MLDDDDKKQSPNPVGCPRPEVPDDERTHSQESSQPDDQDIDEFSDISDNSDVFHVEAIPSQEPRTDEDKDLRICQSIVPHLREHVLMPVDGRDDAKERSFIDTHSGMRLPLLHCSFRGCSFAVDVETTDHWGLEYKLFYTFAKTPQIVGDVRGS